MTGEAPAPSVECDGIDVEASEWRPI
jgi:hypothetical protein